MSGFATGKQATIVAGRACGKCSLCCKVLGIGELAKPAGSWCTHCRPGKVGCLIYEDRPSECRTFNCLWLTNAELDVAWHPLTAKIVAHLEDGGNRVAVRVDPAFPTRWREEPYYGRLKQWARYGVDHRAQVVVYVGKRAIVVLPNKDVDLGPLATGDFIMIAESRGPLGRDWRAYVEPAASRTSPPD
jgi:hypothetical protein